MEQETAPEMRALRAAIQALLSAHLENTLPPAAHTRMLARILAEAHILSELYNARDRLGKDPVFDQYAAHVCAFFCACGLASFTPGKKP